MKKLDRFLLREILSDGPAGTVYKAEEILPGDNRRPVALKVLPAIPEGGVTGETPAERRFFAEVKALAQLGVHPHVVTIYALGLTDGHPWLAMELSPATAARLLGDRPGDPAEVLRLLEHVGRGLAALHGLHPPLVHQDLKPTNILLDPAGNYKITDFSSATAVAENRTFGLATVRYAAPEVLSSVAGRVGPATDLYALGHIAYEAALGGRLHRQQFPAVFEGNPGKEPPPTKWMSWHASMDTQARPIHELRRDFPAPLSEVIAHLMAKRLANRTASATDLLGALAALRGQIGAPSSTAPIAPASAPADGLRSSESAAGPPPEVVSNLRYWVRLRGKVTGPFDLAALQRQLRQGTISRLHQVSTDQVTWRQASEIEGLYGPTLL